MSSENHVLSQLTFINRVAKRAQYEALEFSLETRGVCVRNTSHANPANHEYLVTVCDGIPIACECPADARYDGACKHHVGVAIRTPLLQAATDHSLVADGGTQIENNPETHENGSDTDKPADCDCDDWVAFRVGLVCDPGVAISRKSSANHVVFVISGKHTASGLSQRHRRMDSASNIMGRHWMISRAQPVLSAG
jgi:hypothetical protein